MMKLVVYGVELAARPSSPDVAVSHIARPEYKNASEANTIYCPALTWAADVP